MKISKKLLSIILCICLISGFSIFSGCSSSNESGSENTQNELSIVCTIFPEYDWVVQILGDNQKNADLTLLMDSGVDLHSYQPTADDIIKISNCDIFIYVGGESDKWVEDALGNAGNENMTVIKLFDVLEDSVKEEEIIEGMQADEDEPSDDGEEAEYDEHVWLSLKNAETICSYIAQKLGDKDPVNSDTYTANSDSYIEKLKELDTQYLEAVENAKQTTLLFGDRFPFRYMVDDYNLNYYAAFAGCSAETEASFETISFLAAKADELSLGSIITIEGTDHSIAETIVKNTKSKNQSILSLNSMQSVTAEDIENGVTYLSIMQDNLAVLKQALA